MLPVVSLNNIKIGNGKVGKIYNKLETWSRNVGVNIKSNKNWIGKKAKVTPYRFKMNLAITQGRLFHPLTTK